MAKLRYWVFTQDATSTATDVRRAAAWLAAWHQHLHGRQPLCMTPAYNPCNSSVYDRHRHDQVDGILPKGPYLPCLRMADRALLAGYPRSMGPVFVCGTSKVNALMAAGNVDLVGVIKVQLLWQWGMINSASGAVKGFKSNEVLLLIFVLACWLQSWHPGVCCRISIWNAS